MEIPEWSKKIEYGLTNDSYLLKNNTVLRIGSVKMNKIIDRKNEMEILKLMKKHKHLTTEILDYGFSNTNEFFLKTKFLQFSYNLVEQDLTKEKIKKIFDLITSFRKIDISNYNIKIFDYKEILMQFKKNISNPLIDLTQYEIELKKMFKNYSPKKLVLSHNDMVRGNFLFDDIKDKVYLIDFEYSCINDELFDIASFISETIYTEKDKAKKQELKKYWINLFKLTEKDKINLKKWIFFQNILYSYWANAMFDITKEKIFLEILQNKYHELKNSIN